MNSLFRGLNLDSQLINEVHVYLLSGILLTVFSVGEPGLDRPKTILGVSQNKAALVPTITARLLSYAQS